VTCWLRAATCSAPRARPVHSPLRASALSPLSWTAEATAGTSDKNAVRLAPCLARRQRSVRCCFSLQNQLSSPLRLSPCPSALPRQTVQFRRHSGQGRARRNPAPVRPSFTLCPGSHPSRPCGCACSGHFSICHVLCGLACLASFTAPCFQGSSTW
jgi:hypothetical protein